VAGIHLFVVIPAVSGGYPSERRQPGFPIITVGNDEEERFPTKHVRNDNQARLQVTINIEGFITNDRIR